MKEPSRIPTAHPPLYSDHSTLLDVRQSFISRQFPSTSFYWKVFRIIYSASMRAKKGRYFTEDWYESSKSICNAIESCGGKIEIEGTENISKAGGPCVIIGNHMSTAETFLMPWIVLPHTPVTFVVKQSLVDYPIFKHLMRSRDPIVVGRKNARDDFKTVMEEGQKNLEKGMSVIIFPQRTRQVRFIPEEFNTIGVKLAKRAGVKVVPLALKTDGWGNGKKLKDFGVFDPLEIFRFRFAEPIEITDNGRTANEAVIEHVKGSLKEWNCLL